MSGEKSEKPLWFAPVCEQGPPFGFKPSGRLVHGDSTNRIVRFVCAAHAMGAGPEAIAAFLNDLKSTQTTPRQEPEGY